MSNPQPRSQSIGRCRTFPPTGGLCHELCDSAWGSHRACKFGMPFLMLDTSFYIFDNPTLQNRAGFPHSASLCFETVVPTCSTGHYAPLENPRRKRGRVLVPATCKLITPHVGPHPLRMPQQERRAHAGIPSCGFNLPSNGKNETSCRLSRNPGRRESRGCSFANGGLTTIVLPSHPTQQRQPRLPVPTIRTACAFKLQSPIPRTSPVPSVPWRTSACAGLTRGSQRLSLHVMRGQERRDRFA